MARRPSLSGEPLSKKPAGPPPIAQSNLVQLARSKSRREARAVTMWVPAEAKEQLREMVHELRIPGQQLCEEALNDLFAKYGRHRIAALDRKER